MMDALPNTVQSLCRPPLAILKKHGIPEEPASLLKHECIRLKHSRNVASRQDIRDGDYLVSIGIWLRFKEPETWRYTLPHHPATAAQCRHCQTSVVKGCPNRHGGRPKIFSPDTPIEGRQDVPYLAQKDSREPCKTSIDFNK